MMNTSHNKFSTNSIFNTSGLGGIGLTSSINLMDKVTPMVVNQSASGDPN